MNSCISFWALVQIVNGRCNLERSLGDTIEEVLDEVHIFLPRDREVLARETYWKVAHYDPKDAQIPRMNMADWAMVLYRYGVPLVSKKGMDAIAMALRTHGVVLGAKACRREILAELRVRKREVLRKQENVARAAQANTIFVPTGKAQPPSFTR